MNKKCIIGWYNPNTKEFCRHSCIGYTQPVYAVLEEKPITIQVFRICSKCNKEFEVAGSVLVPEFIKGAARGYVTTFMRCPHCKKRNDIWVRVQAVKDEK